MAFSMNAKKRREDNFFFPNLCLKMQPSRLLVKLENCHVINFIVILYIERNIFRNNKLLSTKANTSTIWPCWANVSRCFQAHSGLKGKCAFSG